MNNQPTRQSLELTESEWSTLEQLAVATQSLSTRGPTAKQPSWRILIKRIASGEINLEPTQANVL